MCIVTLSVVKKCQHELTNIELCRRAERDLPEEMNEAAILSGEELLPRMSCTPSLGWLIFETLDAPVTCESCKAWLKKNDTFTYGYLIDEIKKIMAEGKQKDDVAPEKSVKRSRGSIVYTSKGPALPGSPAARRKRN